MNSEEIINKLDELGLALKHQGVRFLLVCTIATQDDKGVMKAMSNGTTIDVMKFCSATAEELGQIQIETIKNSIN